MSGILRTWLCQNRMCSSEFDSWERNPECPTCGCVRVEWCPRGGHIAGISKGADAEFRALADAFKMDDFHSAARGEAAKKRHVGKPVDPRAPVHDFGGFAAPVDMTQATCVPAANKINFKTSLATGKAFSGVGQHRKV
jgi:hypothetical protein